MKNSSQNKTFKIKQPVVITVLFSVIAALSAAGTVYNAVSIALRASKNLSVLTQIIMVLLCSVMLAVALLSVFCSKYEIADGVLIKRIGFFVEKITVDEITEIKKFKAQNALVVYTESEYSVISINERLYDDFTDALKEVNPKISYLIT